MILQSDFDSTKNNFLGETETFMFLSESGTVPSAPLDYRGNYFVTPK
jgi:hypothetical protein